MQRELKQEKTERSFSPKKPYQKPAIEAEEPFELMSLNCGPKATCAANNIPPSG